MIFRTTINRIEYFTVKIWSRRKNAKDVATKAGNKRRDPTKEAINEPTIVKYNQSMELTPKRSGLQKWWPAIDDKNFHEHVLAAVVSVLRRAVRSRTHPGNSIARLIYSKKKRLSTQKHHRRLYMGKEVKIKQS